MKKIMLATVSALALGLGGIGVGHAAEPATTAPNPPATNMQTPGAPQEATPGTQQEATQGTQQEAAPVNLSEDQVKQVQEQLKTAGVYKGRIDGKMGPETQEAIKDFQQKNGLEDTGTLDQRTMAALQNNQGSGSSMAAPGAAPGAQPMNGATTPNEGNSAAPQEGATPNQMPQKAPR